MVIIYIFAAIGFIQTAISIGSSLYSAYVVYKVAKGNATRKEKDFIKIGEQTLDYLSRK